MEEVRKSTPKDDEVLVKVNSAEFTCVPEDSFVAVMPWNMTYEEGAPICGVLAAWNFLRDKADVQRGQRVLVNGASGSIGTAAVQLASLFDAESKSSFSRCRRVLTPDGVYLRAYRGPIVLLQMLLTSRVGRKKAITSATGLMPVPERLAFAEQLTALWETEELRSVIDRCYPLAQIADAYRHAERGHKRGTVVPAIHHDDTDR